MQVNTFPIANMLTAYAQSTVLYEGYNRIIRVSVTETDRLKYASLTV